MTEKITTTSCECCRHTERTERERKRLMTRLKTMEGQIRGIDRQVENDAYCPDIVMQVSAVSNALNPPHRIRRPVRGPPSQIVALTGCGSLEVNRGSRNK